MAGSSRVAELFTTLPKTAQRGEKSRIFTTHVCRGVRYLLGPDAEASYWKALQSDVQDRAVFCIQEMPSESFHMFFKLNLNVPTRLDDLQISELAAVLHSSVKRFFSSETVDLIPGFFEQIWLEAKTATQCSTRSELIDFVRKEPFLVDKSMIKIVNGAIQFLNGETFPPTWIVPPTHTSGIFKISIVDDVVSLSGPGSPCSFVNPRVYSAECKAILQTGPAPPHALLVSEEEEKMLSCSEASGYTPDTVFLLEDGFYFYNIKTENGHMLQEMQIIFPELIVSVEQALCMREAFIATLADRYGVSHAAFAPSGWYDVVDGSVYGAGLRVCGSSKMEECSCGNKRGCPRDCKNGKVFIGGRLELAAVFIDGIVRQDYSSHYSKHAATLIKKTSIRTSSNTPVTPGWERYSGCPNYGQDLKKIVTKSGHTWTKFEAKAGGSFKTDKAVTRGGTTEVTNPAIIAMLQSFIRTRFCVQQYSQICVTAVKKSNDADVYFIEVTGHGRHYCLNIQSDHQFNTIYFQCELTGVSQRCRCSSNSADDKCRNGPCKLYKSKTLALNRQEKTLLFSESKVLKRGR